MKAMQAMKSMIVVLLARVLAWLLASKELRQARRVQAAAAKRDQISWWLCNSVVCDGCGLRVNPSLLQEHVHIGHDGAVRFDCPPCFQESEITRSYPPSHVGAYSLDQFPTLPLPTSGDVDRMARREGVGGCEHLRAFWLGDDSIDRLYYSDMGGEA